MKTIKLFDDSDPEAMALACDPLQNLSGDTYKYRNQLKAYYKKREAEGLTYAHVSVSVGEQHSDEAVAKGVLDMLRAVDEGRGIPYKEALPEEYH